MNEPSQEDVRARLFYEEGQGRLLWLPRPRSDFSDTSHWSIWNARYPGAYAGTFASHGRRVIAIFGKRRYASRLTWVYHHGKWPEGEIDHIDGNVANDSIENLRDVSAAINCKNKAVQHTSKTGILGVYMGKTAVHAHIYVEGQRIYLGSFASIDEAAKARKRAERKYDFHPNHGRARRPIERAHL